MKLTNFINLLATATVVSAAAGVAIGCQQEPVGPERLEGDIEIALQMEDLATKVDIADKTGAGTWTTGDEIAVHVTETGVGTGYRDYTINAAGSYHFTMNANITLDGYVISPAIMCDYADPAPLGSTPRIIYRTEYSMTGRDLTSPTFSYVPMMAVNDDELLYFYHVGGLVRLAMQGVPEGTNKVVVTFDGMTNVTGTCTVSNPGTNRAAATITSGSGNLVTFTNVNRTAANLYLNVPIPTGDYSALTSITVEAFQDATSKGIVRINQRGRWSNVRHGHGRVIPVSFTSNPISGVRLSSTADVTLWKSQKVQRTAVPYGAYDLEYPDATVEWSSSDEAVAFVNSTTGIVTAVSAGGPVTITATATPTLGGTPKTATYQVYVNAITGIDVPNSHSVKVGLTKTITASLTNTNNGVPTGTPSDMVVSWVSSTPAKVTVSSATTTPVRVDATHMTASVVVNGIADGTSTLTASVTGYGSVVDNNNTVTCTYITDLTFPDFSGNHGEPYKFRGYYMHPGVLFWDGSAFSITSVADPLVLLQHYYYDSRTTKFNGSSGTAWVNACYFTWPELQTRLGSSGYTITGTVSAPDPVSGVYCNWRIPTLGNKTGEWYTIYNSNPTYGIKVNNFNSGNAYTNNTANLIYVNVSLSDAPAAYKNKGLGYYGSHTNNTSGTKAYQEGALLVPDGAYLVCSGIKAVPGITNGITASGGYNVISYEDLEILTSKGCIFLLQNGYYFGSSWANGGENGVYWSASGSSGNAYAFEYTHNNPICNNTTKSLNLPVRLIHD